MKVQHIRTNVDGSKPSINTITYGELVVNYNPTNPRLMTKGSDDNIINFLPEFEINKSFEKMNDDVQNISENVTENKTNLETLEAWIGTPLTDREIAEIFGVPSIKVTYNVTSTSEPTKLAYSALPVKKVKIDGVTIVCDSIQSYTFDTLGEHTVEYTFTDDTITNSAFSGCTNLTSVVISELVTTIKNSAFSNCSGLTGDLVIPDSVTSIGNNAFYYCSGLTGNLVIPDSVTSIGNNAFSNCSKLTSLTIGSGVTSIGNYAFSNCKGLTGDLIIPDSVTSIGDNAFSYCGKLTGVTIGSGVTSIGNWVFSYCYGLTSAVIPDSVTTIGQKAFYYCSGLTSISLGSGVTTIGQEAFYNCNELTGNLVIPDSVTSIGNYAFNYCSKLTSIVVDSGNTIYDSRENCNCIIETSTNKLIVGCNNSFIPDSVTSIGDSAFNECTGLTGDLVIPDSVTSIGNNAFSNCSKLTSLTIGSGVTSIGKSAFSYCKGLTSITSYAVTAPTIQSNTFRSVKSDGTLYVPEGSTDSYSTWMGTGNYYLGKYNWTIEEMVIITFTIDGVEYQAEEGMTFQQWVESNYSPTTCYTSGSYVYYKSGYFIRSVSPNTVITEGKTYQIANNVGGGDN